MYKYLFIPVLLSLLTVCTYSQDDAEKTEAEKQADSILNEYLKKGDANALTQPGIDSAQLEEAESKYMKNFLRIQRDEKKELLYKRVLQVIIGITLLLGLFFGLRRRKV